MVRSPPVSLRPVICCWRPTRPRGRRVEGSFLNGSGTVARASSPKDPGEPPAMTGTRRLTGIRGTPSPARRSSLVNVAESQVMAEGIAGGQTPGESLQDLLRSPAVVAEVHVATVQRKTGPAEPEPIRSVRERLRPSHARRADWTSCDTARSYPGWPVGTGIALNSPHFLTVQLR